MVRNIQRLALTALHSLAVTTSAFAIRLDRFSEYLWEKGGNLECWCDEHLWQLRREHDEWNPVPLKGWLMLPLDDEAQWLEKPRAITLLDDYAEGTDNA